MTRLLPFPVGKVGIIGCGHLGQAVAQALVHAGLPKECLLLSHKGSDRTLQRLEQLGLSDCVATNETVLRDAEIVFLTIRPMDLPTLQNAAKESRATLVSCIAGIPLSLLYDTLGANAHRMMFSGPDTILSGTGVAALYPDHTPTRALLTAISVRMGPMRAEDDLDVFTAGVCLPAAILFLGKTGEQAEAIGRIAEEYPLLTELYAWACSAAPQRLTSEERTAYIHKMVTRGGVTEAILGALESGAPLDAALQKGIARTKEMALELRHRVMETIESKQGGFTMDRFENVTVVKKANIYFDGKVTSRTVLFADGTRKTLGVILPGQYEFSTADKEQMEVLAGRLNVLLPGGTAWVTYGEGQMFEIPANSSFSVSAAEATDYCCSYIPVK